MTLPQIVLSDWLSIYDDTFREDRNILVNIRGTNGSGKSTVPLLMLDRDPLAYEVLWPVTKRLKGMITVFPTFGWIALGHYHTKTGGMDTIRNTQEIRDSLALCWNSGFNILMEGVIASTVRSTYIKMFNELNATQPHARDVTLLYLFPPVEVCLERIRKRNGGAKINEQLVRNKRRMVGNGMPYFREAGFRVIEADNSGIRMEDTLDWFNSLISV